MRPVTYRDTAPGLTAPARPRNRWEKLDLEKLFAEDFRFLPTGIYSRELTEDSAGSQEATGAK